MNKEELAKQVVIAGRESGINMALFRNLVGEKLHLNLTDMECLDVLFYRQVASPSELSTYTGLSSSATTAMLDRLERSGLVKRQPNPNDRRGILITIVDEAIQKIAPFFVSVRQAQSELLAQYTAAELELLADYLAKSAAMWQKEQLALKSQRQLSQ